jgi:hypothetical protein
MKLSIDHIDPNNADLPFEKLALLERAGKLDPRLASMLWEEISNGNFIWEAGYDFPSDDSLYVSLSHPFRKVHKVSEDLTYSEKPDPHYNTACYVTQDSVPHALCAPIRD